MTKRILIIGLGHFGSRLAQHFSGRNGYEIYALDRNEKARKKVEMFATCLGGNLDNPEVIKRALEKIGEVDTAVLSLGSSMNSTTLAALQLRKSDAVKRVFIKVDDHQHEEVLNTIDRGIPGDPKFIITIPEIDAASNIADRILNDKLERRVQLDGDVTLAELPCPEKMAGKPLAELNARNTWKITVVGFRDDNGEFKFAGPESELVAGHTITIVGKTSDVHALNKVSDTE